VSWYLGQFWLLLLLSFVLGALVGYWWWRRQFRRTQVSASSSTQGSCGHGPLLAEKDAEIKRLRAVEAASADHEAEIARLSAGGAAATVAGDADVDAAALGGDVTGSDLFDQTADSANGVATDEHVGDAVHLVDASAADDAAAQADAAVEGDAVASDAVEGGPAADGSADLGHVTQAEVAGTDVLDDTEATTRVHLAGSGLAPDVTDSVEAGHDAAAVTEGEGVAATLAGTHTDAGHSTPDDLERVEGIGPRIAGALKAAGIHTFRGLSEADVATLQSALEAGGLRFAPSLPTWARQAKLLADGDEDGFKALTDRLVAGRDTGSNG